VNLQNKLSLRLPRRSNPHGPRAYSVDEHAKIAPAPNGWAAYHLTGFSNRVMKSTNALSAKTTATYLPSQSPYSILTAAYLALTNRRYA
jgi:hypothetical protein